MADSERYGFLQEYLRQKTSEYRSLYKRWRTEYNAYDYPPPHLSDKSVLLGVLPPELLLFVCNYLYQADMLHLALTSRTFADFIIPLLYSRDITHFDCLSLRWGCTFGVIGTLEHALRSGASVDHRFEFGSAFKCSWVEGGYCESTRPDTPLKIAIRANEAGVVRFLCEEGADVNAQETFYPFGEGPWRPVQWAIGSSREPWGASFEPGNPQILRHLLQAGADPDPPLPPHDYRFSPLALAMRSAVPVEAVRLLLEAGAKPFPPWDTFKKAVDVPRSLGIYLQPNGAFHVPLDEDKIDLLLAHADPTTLLYIFRNWLDLVSGAYTYSKCQQFARVTSLFVAHGVDLVRCVEFGISPILSIIHAARKWAGHLWGVRPVKLGKVTFLMQLVHNVITDMCEATLVAGQSSPTKKSTIIDALNFRPDTDNGGTLGRHNTALRVVCMPFGFPGRPSLIPRLLEYGADLHMTDPDGAGVLHYAATFGTDDRLLHLLEFLGGTAGSGLDVNVRDKYGWTPLHYACLFGVATKLEDQVRTSKLLLDNGADIHARTDDGWTCLQFSVRCRNDGLASLLLERGARPEEKPSPPGWEETNTSCNPIKFCECVERAYPYLVAQLVAHYRRASTAAYTVDAEGVDTIAHFRGCGSKECKKPLYFPFGVFEEDGSLKTDI